MKVTLQRLGSSRLPIALNGILPNSLPSLKAWYSAKSFPPNTPEGSPVTRWPEKKRGIDDLILYEAGDPPQYRSAILNGLPGVWWDGSAISLYQKGELPQNKLTMFAVGYFFSTDQTMVHAINGLETIVELSTQSFPSRLQARLFAGGENILDWLSYGGTGALFCIEFDPDTAVLNLYVNGVLRDSATGIPAFDKVMTDLIVGARSDGSQRFVGAIQEIAMFDGAFTSDTRKGLEWYFSGEWALGIPGTIMGEQGGLQDITDTMDDDTEQTMVQEIEKLAFERVCGDLKFKVSNLDGFYSREFNAGKATSQWEIVVLSDVERKIFRGRVYNPSIRFDFNKEWVTFDVFHITKAFWERAKLLRVYLPPSGMPEWGVLQGDYCKWQDIIHYQEYWTNLNDGNMIYAGRDFGDSNDPQSYHNRPIRGWTDNTEIGNIGRFKELDPETTIAELLDAAMQYYNAEIFVDPETDKLTMRRRAVVLADVEHQIDAILRDDEDVELQWLEEEKVDYIYTFGAPTIPLDALTYVSERQIYRSGIPGLLTCNWLWTCTFNNNDGDALMSGVIQHTTGQPSEQNGFVVTMRVPVAPYGEAVHRRSLYRYSPTSGWRRVATIENNSAAQNVEDGWTNDELEGLPLLPIARSRRFYSWVRYDEETGLWTADFEFNVAPKPNGVIFELKPSLRFRVVGSEELGDDDPQNVLSFFGNEQDINLWYTQWRDWFRTRRRAKVPVKGAAFKLGDSAVSTVLNFGLPQKYLIRRSSNTINPNREESMLELVTL